MADDGMYLENLDEFINDEDKVVTYKWLSRTLSVHVNTAKQMLYAFVKKQEAAGNDDLNVTYFVVGVKNNGGDREILVQIVPEKQLESFKATLECVTSCHIYSVQRAKLKDTNALYMADYEFNKTYLVQSNEFSGIVCPSAVARSEEELQKLKLRAQPTTEAATFAKFPTGEKPAANKKKADIGSMFANQKNKSPEKKDIKKEENKEKEPPKAASEESKTSNTTKSKVNSKPTKGKQGGLSTFFANQAAKPKKEKPPPAEENRTIKEEEKKDSPVKSKSPEKKPIVEKKKPIEKKSQRRKNGKDTHDEGSEKKRRRIQVVSDSSDDEEEEEEEEMEVEPQPPSPPSPVASEHSEAEVLEDDEEPLPKEMRTVSESGKRRKRTKKMVSKTYVNDEGYMVTEKVMESASETDQSEAEEVKGPAPKAPAAKTPKNTSPVKEKTAKGKKGKDKEKTTPEKTEKAKKPEKKQDKKQGNIMSFFKKK